MDFKEILNRKIEHYGKTEAAYEFAAEEYSNRLIKQAISEQCNIGDVSITEGKLPLWTNSDVDAAYLMGCINVGGMDALQEELNRLKELGLKPHQAVGKVRGKSGN